MGVQPESDSQPRAKRQVKFLRAQSHIKGRRVTHDSRDHDMLSHPPNVHTCAFLIPYYHSGILYFPLLPVSTGWFCPGYTRQTFRVSSRRRAAPLHHARLRRQPRRINLCRSRSESDQIWDVTDLERIGGLIGPIACRPTHNSICPPWNIYISVRISVTPSLVISDRLSFATQEVDLAAGNRKSR